MADILSSGPATASQQFRQAVEPTLTEQEQRDIRRRIGSALVATALLGIGWVYARLYPDQSDVANLILFIGAIIAAAPVFVAAVRGLGCRACRYFPTTEPGEDEAAHEEHSHERGSEHNIIDQLVSLAVLAAMATGTYSTAILVPLLMAIGHFLEERSVLGAKAAIRGLRRLRARNATRVTEDGKEETIALEELRVGDELVVRPGEVFAADGRVTEGHSAVDQSAVTGESVPEDVAPGSTVYAGTVNVSGMLHMEVTKLGDDTAMGQVLDTLQEAERSKPPVVQLLEQYSGYYIPFVLVVALVTLLLSQEIDRAVALLVVACPCALVLSSSTAMVASLALASRWGVLIKNTRFLEVLSEVRSLILDKTGTVTLGHLDVSRVEPVGDVTAHQLMLSALTCAQGSRHPVSRAIVREAEERNLAVERNPEIAEHPGEGVEARLNGETIYLGNADWLRVPDDMRRNVADHVGPAVWVKKEDQVLGAVLLADSPRPAVRDAIEDLRELGIHKVILLTGDRPEVARALGEFLQADEYHAELLPTQKLDIVQRESASGQRVLAVGDGINDAPALATADVGVAMGAMGSDAAIQSADIALMTNDITRLPTAVKLSRITRRTINTNVLIGIGTALVLITLASLGIVGAIVGVLLHNVGAVGVVLNSARLLRLEL